MNLKELSVHLGLSKTTVSRALNGFPEVSEETRRLVEEAARRFGYTPNAAAQRLATGCAGAIGVVFPSAADGTRDPLFADFLSGLIEGAGRSDTDIVVGASCTSEEIAYRRLARSRSIDALILTGTLIEDVRVRALSHLDLPVVVHGRTASSIPYPHLDIDNEGAFRRATDMLIRLGHRRIGLVNGELRYTSAVHRSAGWHAAHADHGLIPADHLEASGPVTDEFGYRETRRMLESATPPTAMLCAGMFSVVGCCRAIRDLGLRIGEEVSVVAHDDGLSVLRPEAHVPALTTTFSSIRAAGVRTAEMARLLVTGTRPETLHEIWPVDIIFRDSAHPPRSRR